MIRTGVLWDKLDAKLSPKARKVSRIIRWTLIAGLAAFALFAFGMAALGN